MRKGTGGLGLLKASNSAAYEDQSFQRMVLVMQERYAQQKPQEIQEGT